MDLDLSSVSTEALYEELKRRKASEPEKLLEKSPNGMTRDKLVVVAMPDYDYWTYGLKIKTELTKKGAPYLTDDFDQYSDWAELLPSGFSSVMENTWEYEGSHEEACKALKEAGLEVFEYDWNFDCPVSELRGSSVIFLRNTEAQTKGIEQILEKELGRKLPPKEKRVISLVSDSAKIANRIVEYDEQLPK